MKRKSSLTNKSLVEAIEKGKVALVESTKVNLQRNPRETNISTTWHATTTIGVLQTLKMKST